MRKLTAALATALCLAGLVNSPAWSDTPGVLGIMGANGSFHPLARPTAVTAATTKVEGLLTLTLKVSIVSAIASGTAMQCTLNAFVFGESASGVIDSITEQDIVTTTTSSTSATCTMQIPYEWTLQGISDTVSLSYIVSTLDASGKGRLSDASFVTIALPKSGATTKFTVATRI